MSRISGSYSLCPAKCEVGGEVRRGAIVEKGAVREWRGFLIKGEAREATSRPTDKGREQVGSRISLCTTRLVVLRSIDIVYVEKGMSFSQLSSTMMSNRASCMLGVN